MAIDTTGTIALIPGLPVYRKNSGVILNSKMRGFAADLYRRSMVPIVITSGTRTTSAQAGAMRIKLDLGEDLHALYAQDDLVSEILAGNTSQGGIQATLDRQVARGRYISRHMRADALDVRTAGATPTEIGKLRAAMEATGTKHIFEGVPLHLHIEGIGAQYTALDPYVIGGAAVSVAGFWWLTR
jgi:hypothetical protein